MNDETTTLDQTDEDILTYTVSDEAIEAAAGIERGAAVTHAVSYFRGCCVPDSFSLCT